MDADYALVVSMAPPRPPFPPEMNGPSEGGIGKQYEYTVMTTDPQEEDVYYWIDWGDETNTSWIGPYASGEVVNEKHTWLGQGVYDIKGKAKNVLYIESLWSEPINITIFTPELDIGLISGGIFKINAAIKNIGGAEATSINWSITLEGGTILLGRETSDTIANIPEDGEVNVSSMPIIGFGNTMVTVSVEEPYGASDSRSQSGFVFLFFIKVNPSG